MKTEELIKRMREDGYQVDLGDLAKAVRISLEKLSDQRNNDDRYAESQYEQE